MSAPPSDAELVAQALSGTSGAFDELVDRYWRGAVAMAWQRTRRWNTAEDAAQEAFVLAFRKLGSLRSPERFGGWLFTIVHRACIENARRKSRRPVPISDIELMTETSPGSSESASADTETRREIMEAIEALPERYRPVVVLRYGQGMPVKDIGRALGLPVGTVVSQIFRANRILRTQLKHLVARP